MIDEKWRKMQANPPGSLGAILIALERLWLASRSLGPDGNSAVRRNVDDQLAHLRALVIELGGQARLDQFDGEMARCFPNA
jgi:hypothetical protein